MAMATKFLIASLLLSLLVLYFAEAGHDLIVEALARQGASYHRGHACAREHVGLVVQDAAVFLQEQPLLIASLLVSLLVLHLAEADQKTVVALAKLGVRYPLGLVFARGLAGHAAPDANASLKELPATSTPALAMPP
ncbi:hypothetical protein POTOM_007255 [Populus tomentosa]|uniref:DUF21 domain-containing protein n=1 Tax=Populus tomentosa TaxID=118781 RepID=A0A8X8DB35_POPTO|nr:hypothetical protein POTOM_007255 [Populus tomentosa]